ncbi:MAG: N-acetylmuramic acid 6-phosphate etherase [Hyphomicrobiales bacterium]
MPLQTTEHTNEQARALDTRAPLDILSILHQGQIEAAKSVERCAEDIAKAATHAADALSGGGRLVYAAAGSSGLMAMADGLELPGTYGVSTDQLIIKLAGGMNNLTSLPGAPEDDEAGAAREVLDVNISGKDCLIAISASGTTPYALGALRAANKSGAVTIGIANNAPTPLLEEADVAVFLETPPEIIAGSTRMGAGTAQKIALNMLSTLMAVHLGHVHDGHMINLKADNIKLKQRANRIVTSITGCSDAASARYLDAAGGSVKLAILLAAGVPDRAAAQAILETNGQKSRPSLETLGTFNETKREGANGA